MYKNDAHIKKNKDKYLFNPSLVLTEWAEYVETEYINILQFMNSDDDNNIEIAKQDDVETFIGSLKIVIETGIHQIGSTIKTPYTSNILLTTTANVFMECIVEKLQQWKKKFTSADYGEIHLQHTKIKQAQHLFKYFSKKKITRLIEYFQYSFLASHFIPKGLLFYIYIYMYILINK